MLAIKGIKVSLVIRKIKEEQSRREVMKQGGADTANY